MAAATTAVINMPESPPDYSNSMTSSNDPIPLQERSVPNQANLEAFGQGTGAVAHAFERWDYPRINTYRLAAIFFSFLNFGMNDGSYGALVPYVCARAGYLLNARSSVGHLRSKWTITSPTLSRLWSSFRRLRVTR